MNSLVFSRFILHLQLEIIAKDMKQVRLLNTKADACRPSDFISDYHIHIIVLNGSMSFSDRRQMHTAGRNDFVIWQMSNTIEDVSYSDDFEADFLLVSSDFLSLYNPEMVWAAKGYIFIKMNPVFPLNDKALRCLNGDFTQFRHRLANDGALFHDDVIGRVLQIFLFDIWNMYSASIQNMQTDDNSARIFIKFLNLAQKNSLTNRDVAFYASELCITPKYLSQISQMVTHQPASTWIEYYAAFELVRFLNDQSITLTEIASRMAFSSNSHFTRYCKRVTGMTPTEYRSKQTMR
jgi:AraC family transcriptional activator of pobA